MLGWLNSQLRLSGREGTDWEKVCRDVIAGLQPEPQSLGVEAAHAKERLSTVGGFSLANLTTTHEVISLPSGIEGSPTTARMLATCRIACPAEDSTQMPSTRCRAGVPADRTQPIASARCSRHPHREDRPAAGGFGRTGRNRPVPGP